MNEYYFYITTNPKKTVLYCGMTNDLEIRIQQHFENRGKSKTFAGKFYCFKLVYYETYSDPSSAIEREKQIKGWTRKKKIKLIETENPNWDTLDVVRY